MVPQAKDKESDSNQQGKIKKKKERGNRFQAQTVRQTPWDDSTWKYPLA